MSAEGKQLGQVKAVTPRAEVVEQVVGSVESDIISGIQPEVREVRMLIADIRHLTALAFKRIFRIQLALLAINVLTLIVAVSLLF